MHKTMILLIGVALLTGATASAALADGPYRMPERIADAPFSWTGLYLGAQAGLSRGDVSGEYFAFPGLPGTGIPIRKFDVDGFSGGIHGGYNYQYGSIVFGFEGDIEAADIEGDGAAFISTPQGAVSVPVRTKVNWASSIRGRLGYAVGRHLLYATGGWALADIDNTGQVASLSPFFTPSTSHAGGMIGGWTAGGGFESFVTRRLTVRIEYRHTSFDAKGFGFSLIHNDPNDVTDPSTRIAVDARKLELDSIRVGLSYKFLP